MMKRLSGWKGCRGFTLTEVLVVCAMVGLFLSAAYGTYIGNQRTASSQQEVSEVQQNLRVGMEQFSQDLLNAGFLVPVSQTVTGTATTLTVLRGSDSSRNPRIISNGGMQMVLKTDGTWLNNGFGVGAGCFPVSNRDDLALFKVDSAAERHVVRILAPQEGTDPYYKNVMDAGGAAAGALLKITGIHMADNPPHVCLAKEDAATLPTNEIIYLPGYVIVSTTMTTPFPISVDYALNARNELTRSGVVIAEKISAVRFQYLLADGALADNATATDAVKAVRVTLTSQTAQTGVTGGVPMTRQLVATCAIRNQGSDKGK